MGQPEQRMRIGNPNSSNDVRYTVKFDGRVWKDEGPERGDEINGGTITGLVNGGWDPYRFRGTILNVEIEGGAQLDVNGQSMSSSQAEGYSTSDGHTAPHDDGSGNYARGGSPAIERRIGQLSRSDTSRDEVTVVENGQELKKAIESIPDNHGKEYIVMKDGEYNCGAIQETFSPDKPMNTVSIVGNTEDPLAVQINAPVNITALDHKNEHVHVQGVHFAQRSQFHGQFLFEHCVFSNLTDGNHAGQLGGKPAGGDFRWCHVGHPEDPGEHAADYYGAGNPYFNKDTVLHATGTFLDVNNNVTVDIHGSVSFDGDGDLFDERYQVSKPNLERGLNRFPGGKRAQLSSS